MASSCDVQASRRSARLLLKEGAISSLDPSICNGILVVDVRDMFKNQEEMDLALEK